MTIDPPQEDEGGTRAVDSEAAIFAVPAEAPTVNEELFDVLFRDEVDTWPERTRAGGVRLRWSRLVVGALVLVLAGLSLGSYLQRTRPSSAASLFSSLASAAGRPGIGAFAGAGSGASATGATIGTVTDVIGHTLYVTTSSGSLVKVIVGASTSVDRNSTTSVSGLQVGDTVVVQGSSQGTSVRATSIAASAKGVTSLSAIAP